ncbi:MAG: BMP family lipoprotein [bacterium]|jgi:basic membrane protein A
MKNHLLISVVCLFAFFSACSENTAELPKEKNSDALNVIMITDVGGRGDKGFNDAGWAGCEDARKRLAAQGVKVELNVLESREQTDYEENISLAAERAEVVVALGFLISDAVIAVAPHYPETKFIFIDGPIEAENVASFTFRANEGAFLAGILAAFMSKSHKVAVMPGMDIPPVALFAAGYHAGVKTANVLAEINTEVVSTTIGSFTDPVKAKSIAQSLLGQGADVIFQLAGISGVGVIEAVKEHPEKVFAIGVDINQDDMAPGIILTSVLKRMDRVVSDQIVAVHEGTFQAGVFDVGLKESYVGLTEMENTRHLVPAPVMQTINRAGELIASGELNVPRTMEEVASFQVPLEAFKTP